MRRYVLPDSPAFVCASFSVVAHCAVIDAEARRLYAVTCSVVGLQQLLLGCKHCIIVLPGPWTQHGHVQVASS